MTSVYIYNAPCIVFFEQSVCHEPISVLINGFMLLAYCLLSTLLVVTLTMRELHHWPSIADMEPQRYSGENPYPFSLIFELSI